MSDNTAASKSGPFGDFAEELWELGYSIIPIKRGTKRPFIDYSEFRERQCSRETLDCWLEQYGAENIAIITGQASNLAVIDLDIKGQDDLLNKALSIFPRSPLERFGSKGLGIFVKYDGQLTGRKLRYRGKDIGEVITNTVIVIPPSIHPDTKKPYKWTGFMSLDSELKEDLLEELPYPNDEDISRCEFQLENSEAKVDKDYFKQITGRNDKLKAICGSYINKGLLPEQIAPLLLTDDLILNKKKSLFNDPMEFKKMAETPLAAAYLFASNVFKTYMKNAIARGEVVPQFDGKESREIKKNAEFKKFEWFFKNALKGCKRDRIDGILKKRDWRGFWQPVGNSMNALKSYGTDYGLSPNRMSFHYNRFEREKKKELLCERVTWDGQDHIAQMMVHMSCSNMTNPEMIDLFKDWLVRAIRRIDTGEQNSMIILQGGQGVGKDVFIKNMCGGFAPYYSNFTDASQEKDMFMQVSKNLIINISEFDKLNKKHPGMIKDLISRETAQFRPSHMQHFEDFRMNASFIGSVNPKDFLTDHTGNRRFWVFEDVTLDWQYPKGRGAQILAQATQLAGDGYEADKSTVLKMQRHVLGLSPDSQDEMIVEIWNQGFDSAVKFSQKFGAEYLSYDEVQESMNRIQKFCGMRSLKKVQQSLKRLGAQHRSNGKRLYKRINTAQSDQNAPH